MAITAPESYNNLLYELSNRNIQTHGIQLPEWVKTPEEVEKFKEQVYKIDLNSRQIELPKIVTITYDHNAETIYFRFDRYFDTMDLVNTHCIIQYQNAKPNSPTSGYIYAVPYYDIETYADTNEVVIQWELEEFLTLYAGKITFSIKFFILSDDGSEYWYVLNTLPQSFTISQGLHIDKLPSGDKYPEPSIIEDLIQRINRLEKEYELYWIDV